MAEGENVLGEERVEEYKRIFDYYPRLRELAQEYWDQVKLLEPGPDSVEVEEAILTSTVLQMADVLLGDSIFIKAMRVANADPLENVICESLAMIDIVQNL